MIFCFYLVCRKSCRATRTWSATWTLRSVVCQTVFGRSWSSWSTAKVQFFIYFWLLLTWLETPSECLKDSWPRSQAAREARPETTKQNWKKEELLAKNIPAIQQLFWSHLDKKEPGFVSDDFLCSSWTSFWKVFKYNIFFPMSVIFFSDLNTLKVYCILFDYHTITCHTLIIYNILPYFFTLIKGLP